MKENTDKLRAALKHLLQTQQAEAYARLEVKLEALKQRFTHKDFFYLFAICPRWFVKEQVDPGPEFREPDRFGATANWFYPQFARLSILLEIEAHQDSNTFGSALNQLFDTADVNELILLVQSLQFIPDGERFVARGREAARSNIESVFSALAHNSDYAYRHFDKSGWNQLILKAAFLAVPIWNIYGLRERNNAELITMLLNYVEERQAASRIVPWDLWCCVGWLASSDTELSVLEVQFQKLDSLSAAAIALALRENKQAEAQVLAEKLYSQIDEPALREAGWPELARAATSRASS